MSSVNLINGGLDVLGIVDNLITAERAPIDKLEQRTKDYQDRISAYQAFNSKLLAFKTSVESLLFKGEDVLLNMPSAFADRLAMSLFALRKATSSNEAVVTATAAKGQATGAYTVTVNRMAKYNSYGSNNLASDTATSTNTGTIDISKGTGATVTFTIDATNNTLQGIRNTINNAHAGFTASVINDGSATPYKLVITSDDSGSANALTITPHLQGSGADLSFTQITAAEDAELTVNGVTVTRASNTISDVIAGVTLDLKAGTGTAQISVERDTEAIVEGIKDFISKYNDVVSYISSQSRYDTTKKAAGLLSGDFTLRNAQSQIRSILYQSIESDNASLSLLSQVGVKIGNDGTLSLDETKFKSSLDTNFEDTAHVFLAESLDAGGNSVSIVPMLQSRLKNITDAYDGPVYHATQAIQKNISRINDQIQEMEARLDVRRELLIAQFSRADEALRQLSVLQSSLSGQLSSLSSLS
jgi:flagellar hook-associated protein 2